MAKVLRINSVNSDGSDAEKTIQFVVIDSATNKPFAGEDGKPSVVITLRAIGSGKYREIEQSHTQTVLNKKTRAMERVTDYDEVQDDLVDYAVTGWIGVIGADDRPLQCVRDAKIGLPGELKNDLVRRALEGEAVDAAASFLATA